MKVLITGVAPNSEGMKIKAIKAIRTVTGLPIKDSKDVADAVFAGHVPQAVNSRTAWEDARVLLVEGYLQVALPSENNESVLTFLRSLPGDMTVAQVLGVLTAVADFSLVAL